jgi:hypothetical protein
VENKQEWNRLMVTINDYCVSDKTNFPPPLWIIHYPGWHSVQKVPRPQSPFSIQESRVLSAQARGPALRMVGPSVPPLPRF